MRILQRKWPTFLAIAQRDDFSSPTKERESHGQATATVRFFAPASDGGATISGYTATCAGAATSHTGTASASPITVTGMTNGVAYSCTVTATDSVGVSAASQAVSVTPVAATSETGSTAGIECNYSYDALIDAGTGGSCDDSGSDCDLGNNSGAWNIEAPSQSLFDFGTDDNNAHVQPDGTHHYHEMSEGFVNSRGGSSSSMTLIGWAADDFPIYARYGYSSQLGVQGATNAELAQSSDASNR